MRLFSRFLDLHGRPEVDQDRAVVDFDDDGLAPPRGATLERADAAADAGIRGGRMRRARSWFVRRVASASCAPGAQMAPTSPVTGSTMPVM